MTRLHPRDGKDVAEAIQAALSAGKGLEILSGGTKRSLGRPVDADTVLDLSGLSGIIDYEPSELVLTARAATPLTTIAATLAEHGQYLAFEPDIVPGATLAGALAAGESGSRRPFAGAARDHFLGCAAVSGRGENFKAGGKVVKNVTGYDLPKLLAGSFGTLAVMTEVTVKVLPKPETCVTLAVPNGDLALLRRIAAGPYEASGLAYLPDRKLALIRLEGTRISVVARKASLEGDVVDNEIWARIGQGAVLGESETLWRISCAADRAESFLPLLTEGRFAFDWGGARIWWTGNAAMLRMHLGGKGHATLIRGSEALRRSISPFEPEPPGLAALTCKVKEGFDPKRVLNPGRMFEGI